MKYSLMTHMIDREIKLKKPTFIHLLIMKDMGYQGQPPTLGRRSRFSGPMECPWKTAP